MPPPPSPAFIRSQLLAKLPYPTTSYAGQTIIITGSNTGLGKEAARHYARLGASKVILAVRSPERGEAAKKDIATTAAKKTVIEVWQIDMASYASVKAFAARVEAELKRVDIFHANVGLVCSKFTVAEDNETMITVSVVSTFLLVALILPKLKASAADFHIRPRLVITSSGAHEHTTFPHRKEESIFDALNNENYAQGKYWSEQYPISKLLQIFIVRSIVEEHPADTYPVIINLPSPGLCHSELSREAAGMQKVAFSVVKSVLARSAEKGGRTLVDAGIQGPESHGSYLSDCKIAEPGAIVTGNKDAQDRVWRELKGKLELIQPGVTANF
ncbi:hypothetical protein MMC25_000507 [Agyrium rufum]|nr:hypothetical protein [Agyrium rufum]